MTKEQLKKRNLPDEPGVYIFKKGPKILYIGKATSGGLPSKEADYKPDEKETKKAAKEEKVEVETEVDAEKEVKAAGKHVIETEDDEEIYFCKQHKREEYEGTHDAAKTDKKKKS